MKKIGIYFLIICLIGSFALLLFEYSRYSDVNNKYIALQKEINATSDRLSSISGDMERLKLEEETTSNEKKITIEQYQKWLRQNQILKDLIQ